MIRRDGRGDTLPQPALATHQTVRSCQHMHTPLNYDPVSHNTRHAALTPTRCTNKGSTHTMPACQPCTCHTPLPTGPSTMRCPVHTCTTTLHALPLASSNAGPGSQADCHRARHGDTACHRPIQPGTTLTQMHTSTKTHNATRRQTRPASQSISDAHVPTCWTLLDCRHKTLAPPHPR